VIFDLISNQPLQKGFKFVENSTNMNHIIKIFCVINIGIIFENKIVKALFAIFSNMSVSEVL